MKKFTIPKIDIILFNSDELITTSVTNSSGYTDNNDSYDDILDNPL